ncbi:hypothetical protein THSYN_09810 [Candidatus Thiodictyon syntrophicum]|uniref:Uncharacterized protein n=1 Tax=Candidatus Thiodictyon syntrophicum TaxID=1166950 RepID=A0A2K8U6Q2_9GAMM|nr:hypothetical protein THSYN_09810 [Candidatus Thiodictyon syntrophicum]
MLQGARVDALMVGLTGSTGDYWAVAERASHGPFEVRRKLFAQTGERRIKFGGGARAASGVRDFGADNLLSEFIDILGRDGGGGKGEDRGVGSQDLDRAVLCSKDQV